jgi:hypothetical protein
MRVTFVDIGVSPSTVVYVAVPVAFGASRRFVIDVYRRASLL